MVDNYDMFQFAFGDYFGGAIVAEEEKEEKEIRKDFCYDCDTGEGYWVMMALRCSKCDKILIGG